MQRTSRSSRVERPAGSGRVTGGQLGRILQYYCTRRDLATVARLPFDHWRLYGSIARRHSGAELKVYTLWLVGKSRAHCSQQTRVQEDCLL